MLCDGYVWAHTKRPWASLEPATEPFSQERDAVVVALGGTLPSGPEVSSDPAPHSKDDASRTIAPISVSKPKGATLKQSHNWCVSGHASHWRLAMVGAQSLLVATSFSWGPPQAVRPPRQCPVQIEQLSLVQQRHSLPVLKHGPRSLWSLRVGRCHWQSRGALSLTGRRSRAAW